MVLINDKQLTEDYMLPDGTREYTADQGFGNNKIKNVKDPTDDQDGVNKRHMDNSFQSRDFKESARAGTTGDIGGAVYNATGGPTSRGQFTGMPTTQGGVALAAGDRVLVKDQTAGAENGWYEVTTLGTGADGLWDRAKDFRKEKDVRDSACAFGFIEEGTQKKTGWLLETDSPITIGGASGTTLSFKKFADGGALVLSVFSRDGTVVAVAGDYAATQVDNDSGVSGTTVADALDALAAITAVGPVPVKDDKAKTPSVTSGDGSTTGIAITSTPSGDGYVVVDVNGNHYELGDGVKTKDCYFSADAGATAKTIAAIVATDVLFWNGAVTGFELATSDSVDLNYNVAA